jgi:hypothetical protein
MKMVNALSFLLLLFLFSCQNSSEIVLPEQQFNKIYNDNSFSDFDAIDILQTSDGGYCVLGTTDNSFAQQLGVAYLIRTDKEGNFLWDIKTSNENQSYSNPITNLINKENDFYFFCRRNADKAIVLLKVADAQKSATEIRAYPNLSGDLVYVSETPDQGLLLMLISERCRAGKRAELVKLDANFNIVWSNCYDNFPVFAPVDAITQRINRNYFFNGVFTFNNQTRYFLTLLSENNTSVVLYTDANGNLTGSTRTPFLISSFAQIVNNNFALSFIRQKDTNIVPMQSLEINANQSPSIFGNTFHEINSEKGIITKRMTLNNKEVIIFACTLENIPIRIYAFDPTTGSLRGTLTLGRINPYDVGDIIATSDGGMAIAVSTLVSDRFYRIGILKISPQEVISLVN